MPDASMRAWQRDMALLYRRQMEQGGIIGRETDKKQAVLEISTVSVPVCLFCLLVYLVTVSQFVCLRVYQLGSISFYQGRNIISSNRRQRPANRERQRDDSRDNKGLWKWQWPE